MEKDIIYYDPEHMSLKKDKLQQVAKLVKEGKKMPKQGTKEWLKERKVGGSEVSILLGKNPWKKEVDLVKDKTNLSIGFKGNLATRWGNILEPMTSRLVELIFNTRVEEINMLKGKMKGQTYSPDGVGVVQLKCDGEKEVKLSDDQILIRKSQKLLFEFKAPFSRIPSGRMPKEYICQIQSGLSAIEDADKALFVDAMYRVCSLRDLRLNNKYNKSLHMYDIKKKYIPLPRPIAMGIIVFYQTSEDKEDFMLFSDDCDIEQTLEIESDDDDIEFLEINSDSDSSDDDFFTEPEGYDLSLLETDRMIRIPNFIGRKELREDAKEMKKATKDVLSASYRYCDKTFIQSMMKLDEMDIGEMGRHVIDRLFELTVDDKTVKTMYLDPFVVDEFLGRIDFLYNQDVPVTCDMGLRKIKSIERKIHKSMCKQMKKIRRRMGYDKNGNSSINEIIGFLPWKMFECDVMIEERDMGFATELEPKLDKVTKIIDEINRGETRKDRKRILRKYYPEEDKVFF